MSGPMSVAIFGEAMIELSPDDDRRYALNYAGDTLNTAVYMARAGVDVRYLTALGADDPYSEAMIAFMRSEGIDVSAIHRRAGGIPGLYIIHPGPDGENRFHYWRDSAPIRTLFQSDGAPAIVAALQAAQRIYISGISLAVIGAAGREALAKCLSDRAPGRPLAFDLNYRSRLWESPAQARAALRDMLPFCRFLSFAEGEGEVVFGTAPESWMADTAAGGIEIVMRKKDHSVLVVTEAGGGHLFANRRRSVAVDTTAAGDSFNAAYLAARWRGESIGDAVESAQFLAAQVVHHRGAIMAKAHG